MKEIKGLLEGRKVLPFPELLAFLCLQQQAAVFEAEGKGVLEGRRALVDAEREQAPDRDPETKPEKREDQEGKGLYLLECEQDSRQYREHVDHDDHNSDLRFAKKMAA